MSLVLTRFLDESVIIDHKIEVKIVKVKGKQVRLQFICPKETVIDRKEVYEENQTKRANGAYRNGG